MHVFLTGASGWVGSAVAEDLLAAGHQVTGLVRNAQKAQALVALGMQVVTGTLDDHQLLHDGASRADAVIHTAFNHDFSRFSENCAQDERAIQILGEALHGSDRPLLVTSGVAMIAPGRLATENDLPFVAPAYPRRSEPAARELADKGVRAATIRLSPTVHGVGDHGFIPILMDLAKQTGVSAWPEDAENRWAAVHRRDAATLYRLALETGMTQAVYHAVAEEGILFRDIAQAIGKHLGVPAEPRAREHFGWFADFASLDMAASSEQTRAVLGWNPTHPTLLADLAQAQY
ncbi:MULTISPECIES: SDR family oxidoreductase [Phytobacter]|uniref:3-beta hydroxysteroid dehydrogenase n=1 Tax=Phytobacter diazotrophicus TaxID=395631 RepID=A0ABN6LRP3_9ENTR|nr:MULTISPECIES: SDR family oxidoreductase [Phytobacter]MDU4154964.1 SDR family oxidoreductase [Enterobacteriaceae bacterium]MDU7377605.1 SDR family oxidoreductase [Enterobacteriaceae bacterium]BBE78515.1 3-beta hydroxysteroid dehydrogenase [Phytobacter sp. MRY16-398]BDD51891.1 3-beta hydroxysteroid dehydrogenase [Phytobacter diazotrophicus]BEG82820.1 SDR family oxidoreductase [Phytobacter diazotrophicus]